MKNIYVGNLSFQTSEQDLEATFSVYGQVERAQLVKDRETGKSRGFGFVEMTDDSSADRAIEALNGSQLDGRNLTVNEARPRDPRQGGGGGGGNRFGGGESRRREPRW
jgi:RNA recognition motif-containing protein